MADCGLDGKARSPPILAGRAQTWASKAKEPRKQSSHDSELCEDDITRYATRHACVCCRSKRLMDHVQMERLTEVA